MDVTAVGYSDMLRSYNTTVFGLQNGDGEVKFVFPPQYGPDKIIYFMPFAKIMELSRVLNMKPVLVEVKVTFEPTGPVNPIPSKAPSNSRAVSL